MRLEFENVPSLKEDLETTLQTHQIDFKLFNDQQHTKLALLFLRKIMLSTKFYYVLTEMNCLPKLCVSLAITKTIDNSQKRFISFYYIPSNEDKAIVERKILDVCSEHQVELIVLAKYMQILSDHFVSHYPNQIINIHHSFLPSFIGANPYKQAWERGVKLVGATSHYVTSDLDEGPIIDQDVIRINHRYNVQDLRKIGRHVESSVLAQAVEYHVLHKVIVTASSKTIVLIKTLKDLRPISASGLLFEAQRNLNNFKKKL